MTGSDRRTLDAIFRHPLSHNLALRDVVALFAVIGEADEKHDGELEFRAGEQQLSMQRPHDKDLTGPEVMDLRRLLTRAGWSADGSSAPQAEARPPAPGLIVAIDHAGANIYHIDRPDDGSHGITPHDTRRRLHHFERERRDADRGETYPDDERFFEEIAKAVAAGGEIVVIGHGKGQSNEADHLSADLPHLTTPELGRHAFGR